MNAMPPQLPNLATMNQPPSWTNRAGRADRSMCIELRASDVWPLITLKTVRSSTQREATGSFTITAVS